MNPRFQSARIWAPALALLLVAPLLGAQATFAGGATITFRKVFRSSYPEYVEIKVPENGACTADIRQLSDDPSPQPFQLSQSVVQRIFDLAGELHDFNGVSLEIHRRIANLRKNVHLSERRAGLPDLVQLLHQSCRRATSRPFRKSNPRGNRPFRSAAHHAVRPPWRLRRGPAHRKRLRR